MVEQPEAATFRVSLHAKIKSGAIATETVTLDQLLEKQEANDVGGRVPEFECITIDGATCD